MAKVIGKGTIYKHTISAALTAFAQITEIDFSGAESETYEGRTLDQAVYDEHPLTGYSKPGTAQVKFFWDPALAGHKAALLRMGSASTLPVTNAHQVTYADTTTHDFTVSGSKFNSQVRMNDGLKADWTFTISGDPGFPDT